MSGLFAPGCLVFVAKFGQGHSGAEGSVNGTFDPSFAAEGSQT